MEFFYFFWLCFTGFFLCLLFLFGYDNGIVPVYRFVYGNLFFGNGTIEVFTGKGDALEYTYTVWKLDGETFKRLLFFYLVG